MNKLAQGALSSPPGPGSLSPPHSTLIHTCHVTDSLVAAPVHALCARERVASTRAGGVPHKKEQELIAGQFAASTKKQQRPAPLHGRIAQEAKTAGRSRRTSLHPAFVLCSSRGRVCRPEGLCPDLTFSMLTRRVKLTRSATAPCSACHAVNSRSRWAMCRRWPVSQESSASAPVSCPLSSKSASRAAAADGRKRARSALTSMYVGTLNETGCTMQRSSSGRPCRLRLCWLCCCHTLERLPVGLEPALLLALATLPVARSARSWSSCSPGASYPPGLPRILHACCSSASPPRWAHLGRFDCNGDAVPPMEDIEDDRSGLARAQALLAW